MSYPRPKVALGAIGAADLAPITGLTPSPLPAGPGPQVVTVRSSGLQPGDNLAIYQDDANSAATFPNVLPAFGGPIFNVSADGTTAQCVVNLQGYTGGWLAQIIAPATAEQSPPYAVQSVPGTPAPFNPTTIGQQQQQQPPIPVVVTATPIISTDGPAMVVTGGQATTGTQRGVTEPGPGLLQQQGAGGPWTFTPLATLSAATLLSVFGDILAATPNLEVDPFGLPLPSVHQPYPVPYFYQDGTPAYSPWYQAFATQAGTGVVVPTTALPPTYQAYFPPSTPQGGAGGGGGTTQPVILQDENGNPIAGEGTDLVTTAPAIVSTLPPATGGPSVALVAPGATPPVAMLFGVPVQTLALLAAAGAGLWYLSRQRGAR